MPKSVLFEISKKVILDIKNNNFKYPKINIYFGYQKQLFWISEIVISDIQLQLFLISEINVYFRIFEIVVFDIQNNFFGYLKYVPVLGYPK